MAANTVSPVGGGRVVRAAALAFLAAILVGGPTPANAAGPTFDLTTVADKTYEFRFRGSGPTHALAVFGSFHVDASGAIDSAKAWTSANPGREAFDRPLTITPTTLNKVTLNDPDAGVFSLDLRLQSSDALVFLEGWIRLRDTRGRNGILTGNLTFVGAGDGAAAGDGEIESP